VNLSQSVGTRGVNISDWPVDAVVCAGYKWLCGPYGTGFCWIDPSLRERLQINQAYWISMLTEEELKSETAIEWKDIKSARKLDVFGTANFFNFVPFKSSIDLLFEIGLDNVFRHNQAWIDMFLDRLDHDRYQLISPSQGKWRSNLVVISHRDKGKNEKIFNDLMERGIYTAFWKGNIRIAPHIYNTKDEMDQLLKAL